MQPGSVTGSLSGAMAELESLAGFVHGSVAFGNVLGVLFNLRRRQWRWCALHVAGVVFHVIAARNHARDC